MRLYACLLFLPGCVDWSALYGARCGNGVVEQAEACDDGNADEHDACLSTCQWARCGDGQVRAGVEDCDDGNRDNGDGCSNECLSCNTGGASFLFEESGYCFSRYDEQVNWTTAEARCDTAQASLSTYVNSHEALAVETSLLVGQTTATWIGMRDATGTGNYAWVSAEPAQWSEWALGEPGARLSGCVAQTHTGNLIMWSAFNCADPHGFVCQKAAPTQWAGNHHAYSVLFARLGWQMAGASCQRAGGHLVTIESAAEQAFVAGLAPGDFWIGASDEIRNDAYVWVTGEPADVTFFAPGEPDHLNDAHCLVIGVDEGWHDRPCTDLNAYVCEVE
jgi:cysteine-rich repeat protein